jgi:putative membrane protein
LKRVQSQGDWRAFLRVFTVVETKGESVMSIIGVLLAIVISAALSGLVIYIVSKLNLGLSVDGFGSAFIAAIVIAVIAGVINWVLNLLGIRIGSGILGAIIHIIVSAIVLLAAGNVLPGLKVQGFGGAIIAAIAIGVISFMIEFVLVALGLGVAAVA